MDKVKAIRKKLLGAAVSRATETIDIGDGEMIDIVQPSAGEFEDIMQPLRDKEGRVRDDLSFRLACMCLCCKEPGTGELVFDFRTDLAALREMPRRVKWVETLMDASLRMCVEHPAQEAGKLGEGQPADCCSQSQESSGG